MRRKNAEEDSIHVVPYKIHGEWKAMLRGVFGSFCIAPRRSVLLLRGSAFIIGMHCAGRRRPFANYWAIVCTNARFDDFDTDVDRDSDFSNVRFDDFDANDKSHGCGNGYMMIGRIDRQTNRQTDRLIQKALQKLRNENIGISLGNGKINLLASADNIALLGQTEDDIKKLSKLLVEETRITGLNINSDKTKYMNISRSSNNRGEEHRLRVFENKVLRKIFGAKRDEVTGEWRKLHNAELHAMYSSPDLIRNIKSRRLRWAGHVAHMGESRNAYRVLVGRLKGKRPLGRPRRRWEDNIKMDFREVGCDDRDWINLAQDRTDDKDGCNDDNDDDDDSGDDGDSVDNNDLCDRIDPAVTSIQTPHETMSGRSRGHQPKTPVTMGPVRLAARTNA
ncbi:hypothetical protein ANN_18540 [Periplaneta americana]|uniref:Reverse transcriptase domain-containing protein n=1 Tax=Periplaneta americana TaxID=6978 RepID=A0ABQ8SPP5_PERAM|nr:hypothetical protein ANN_18540 [Periplaneta americana]